MFTKGGGKLYISKLVIKDEASISPLEESIDLKAEDYPIKDGESIFEANEETLKKLQDSIKYEE